MLFHMTICKGYTNIVAVAATRLLRALAPISVIGIFRRQNPPLEQYKYTYENLKYH